MPSIARQAIAQQSAERGAARSGWTGDLRPLSCMQTCTAGQRTTPPYKC
jgi:hypothetical protein